MVYIHDNYPPTVLRIIFVLRNVFLREILLWCNHGAVLEEHLFLCNWIRCYREAGVTSIISWWPEIGTMYKETLVFLPLLLFTANNQRCTIVRSTPSPSHHSSPSYSPTAQKSSASSLSAVRWTGDTPSSAHRSSNASSHSAPPQVRTPLPISLITPQPRSTASTNSL